MNNELLIEELHSLISLKQEGSYWDFKKEWHANNSDLLHDIICFANNLVNRDCYIIIGIDENTDYSIVDVSSDINRKNTQNLVDFLKDKKFAGDIRPIVKVESVLMSKCTVDVIVVKNTFDTPYYLTERYLAVNSNNIYTRVMDTNTPKDRSADINNVEYLWKKRFRMLETPMDKLYYYLRNPEDWATSPAECEDSVFYKYAPEYRIVTERDEQIDGYEYYLFSQTNPRPHWYLTTIYYHQTALETFQELAMDGGRWCAIPPEYSGIRKSNSFETYARFGYYIEGSLRHLLHQFRKGYIEEPYEYRKYMEIMLVFESDDERIAFEQYVQERIEELVALIAKQKEPYMQPISGYDMKSFVEDYKSGKALHIKLENFKTFKTNK